MVKGCCCCCVKRYLGCNARRPSLESLDKDQSSVARSVGDAAHLARQQQQEAGTIIVASISVSVNSCCRSSSSNTAEDAQVAPSVVGARHHHLLVMSYRAILSGATGCRGIALNLTGGTATLQLSSGKTIQRLSTARSHFAGVGVASPNYKSPRHLYTEHVFKSVTTTYQISTRLFRRFTSPEVQWPAALPYALGQRWLDLVAIGLQPNITTYKGGQIGLPSCFQPILLFIVLLGFLLCILPKQCRVYSVTMHQSCGIHCPSIGVWSFI